MLATLDLAAVRRFTADLHDRVRQCDDGEGMVCSRVEGRINYYVQRCVELKKFVKQWARGIFTKQIALDPEAEALLKEEARHLLRRAKDVAAQGRAMEAQCFVLEGLNALHYQIADLDYLLENWVSPRAAVSPAPRVKVPVATEQQIMERLENLPPLPRDWQPTDPEQLALFQEQLAIQKQRAE